jgi:transposase
MSNSLLYHGFGVRGYQYNRTDYREGAVTFTISQPRESYRCSQCGSKDVIGRGGHDRRFRTLPIGGKPVYLSFWVPRVECRDCDSVRRVKVGFAEEGSDLTV